MSSAYECQTSLALSMISNNSAVYMHTRTEPRGMPMMVKHVCQILLVKFYVSRWLDGQIAIEKNAITPDVREG